MSMTARDRIMASRAKFQESKSRGLKPYKLRTGSTMFRILPPTLDKSLDFHRRYGKTYLKSFDGKSFFGIIDRSITFDEPSDPIREMLFDAMRQAPDQDTKKHYQDMLASPRCVFNVLILNDPAVKPDEPQLLDISETQFDNIMSQFLVWSEDDPDYDLAAIDTGHVFSVEKTGQGMDTKYTFLATPKKAPLDKTMVEKAVDLDAWIQSQIEGLQQKALAFLGQVNGSVGITTSVPAALLGASAEAQATASAASQANVDPAMVHTQIEPEDAEFETIAATEAANAAAEAAAAEAEAAALAAAAAAAAAKAKAQAAKAQATKVAETPDVPFEADNTAPPASADVDDIDSILAQLGMA